MTRSLPPEWDDDRRPGGGNPQGNIAPTDWKVIIVAALCGAALGWFALSIYKINDVTVPILPWSLPVVILCLLYTSPSPRDQRGSRMPSSA